MREVDEFILRVDEGRRDIVIYLHHLFTDKLGLKPKLRYRLPFYDHKKWVCYVNPKKSGGVELVFLDGQSLHDPAGILDGTGRKRVSGIMIYELENIPEREIIDLVKQVF